MLCQSKPTEGQHRFHPVILFHNNDRSDSSAILYGDPYYRPLIQKKKERMDQMLQTNSKWWQYITQSTRTQGHDTSPRLSTSSSSSSTCSGNSTSPPPSPLQHRQSLSKQHSPDRHYYQQPQPHRKRRGNLPKTVTAILKQWLIDHCQHPYPTEEEKIALRNKTGLTLNQISNWFINARRRILPLILVRVQPPQEDEDEEDEDEEEEDEYDDDSDYLEDKLNKRGRKGQRHDHRKKPRHEVGGKQSTLLLKRHVAAKQKAAGRRPVS